MPVNFVLLIDEDALFAILRFGGVTSLNDRKFGERWCVSVSFWSSWRLQKILINCDIIIFIKSSRVRVCFWSVDERYPRSNLFFMLLDCRTCKKLLHFLLPSLVWLSARRKFCKESISIFGICEWSIKLIQRSLSLLWFLRGSSRGFNFTGHMSFF